MVGRDRRRWEEMEGRSYYRSTAKFMVQNPFCLGWSVDQSMVPSTVNSSIWLVIFLGSFITDPKTQGSLGD